MPIFTATLPGREELRLEIETEKGEITKAHLTAAGSLATQHLAAQWQAKLTGALQSIPLPDAPTRHPSCLLLRELILKAQGRWNPPFKNEELCHCRGIETTTVIAAITEGHHTPEAVSRATSASTACGTCRPHVEALIDYILPK